MKNRVLLIDDDRLIREMIVSLLSDEGYDIDAVSTLENAKNLVSQTSFDAILLDLQLPDGNGLGLISTLREVTDAPILIISGRTDAIDKIVGLEMGADDYIAKPLHLKEMAARIKAQIRRHKALTNTPESKRISFENFVLDRAQMQVFDEAGKNMGLTAREYKLIEALVMAPKQVHTREQLLNRVRADNLDVTDRAVDVQLLRIRKKLNDNAKQSPIIKSVRGVGYMLNCVPRKAEK